MPLSIRVRKRIVRFKQLVSILAFLLRSRVLTRDDRGLFKDRTIRILRRPIVIGGDRLINERTRDRRMIMLFIAAIVKILLNFLHARRDNDNTTVVPVNGMRNKRLNGLLNGNVGILLLICGPRNVTRAIAQDSGIMCQFPHYVAKGSNVRYDIVKVNGRCKLGINVIRTSVLRAILLFVAADRLILLSSAIRVVKGVNASGGAMLYLTIRNLNVSMVIFFVILRRPTFLLRRARILYDFLVGAFIVFVHASKGVCFQLSSVV